MVMYRVESAAATLHDDASGDRGRHVVCASPRGAQPGAVLLRSAPFAALLDPPLWNSHCHRCFASAEELQPGGKTLSRCGRCRVAYYCSRACQQSDWKPDHQTECSRLPQLVSLRLRADQISDVLLLGRVLRRLKTPSSDEVSPVDLVWNYEDCCQETELLAALTLKLGLVDETKIEEHVTVPAMQRMLSRFQNNNFAICDARLLPVGAGCFPLGAMVNHSCSPNAVATFDDSTHSLVFRAIREIAAGEEITQAYVDVALPRSQRQGRLQRRYHFTCACERCASHVSNSADQFLDADIDGVCEREWPATRHRQIEEAASLLTQADNASDTHEKLQFTLRALGIHNRTLHEVNMQRLSTVSQVFTLQLQYPDSLKDALETGTQMLRVYEKVYPSNHVMIGLHLFTLGDVCAAMSEPESAEQFLKEAQRILRITHGEDHAFVKLLNNRLMLE